MEAIAIPQGFKVTPEQFEQLANTEQLARLELTETGELIIRKMGLKPRASSTALYFYLN